MKKATVQPAGPEVGPSSVETAVISQHISLLPVIMATLGEVRDLLAERQKPLLTVEEFAALAGRKPYTVRTWIRERRIDALRVPGTGPKGRLLIRREELQKLLSSGRA